MNIPPAPRVLAMSAHPRACASLRGASLVVMAVFATLHGCTSVDRSTHDAASLPERAGAVTANQAAPATCPPTPPSLVLSSSAGDQSGVQGSYCAFRASAGCGRCADSAVSPAARQFTVVHAGDAVTISMPSGALVTPDTCNPACPPQLRIRSLDCSMKFDELGCSAKTPRGRAT
jgi:hypothetical protein